MRKVSEVIVMKKINIAVVGATGMVGNKFLEVLTEKSLPVENYYLYASAKSAGKTINFLGKDHTVIELKPENIKGKKIDIALFSAGGGVSKEYAPIFAAEGAVVIDNSSQWRMYDDVPLVVPEVNPEDIAWNKGIIANPNCSTIQAVVALKPLHDKYVIKRVVYSTYQAVSGAGVAGYEDLKNGIGGIAPKKFPYPIFNNILPHIDVFLEDGYTKEEHKMIDETRKILHAPDLKVTATTVRVPVFHGHSESINIEFERPATLEGIRETLRNAPGIVLADDVRNLVYPMVMNAVDHDEVYVGRVRIDPTVESGCNLWCVADNIRKGAASNAVQIAEIMLTGQIKRNQ
jgi:aspartate-semialdehyde dehydrogenase